MYLKSIFFIVLFLPGIIIGQKSESGSLSGKITTADSLPAGHVTVLIRNAPAGTITDENGKFEIGNIKPGIYVLHVSLLGYNDVDIEVSVLKDETTYVNIPLKQTYAELQNIMLEASRQRKYAVTEISEGLRLNLPLIEIPQNIQVTSHQLLADEGLLSMTETIRTVSGVQKYYGGLNDYQFIIRGTIGQFNVLRNGMAGFWWNQQEDVEMLEKTEFIKGPAGFMMSMNEPGGIVNIVTKQPVRKRTANINSGFGSYNLFRLAADLGGTVSKKSNLFYRFNAGVHTQKRAFQFGKASRYFICAAVTYNPDLKTSLTAEYNGMFGKTSGNNENLPSINGKLFSLRGNFAVADAGTDQYAVNDNYFRLQLRHHFNTNWHLNVMAAYAQGYAHNHLIYADADLPVSNDTLYRYFDFSNWHNSSKTAQVYVDGAFNTGNLVEHKVLTGIDYCSAYVSKLPRGLWGKELGLYIPDPDYHIKPDLLNNFEVDQLHKFRDGWVAFYLQDHIKIANKLVITVAGRFTHSFIKWKGIDFIPPYQQNTVFNVFTPRAGVSWLFSEYISIYTLYDQCFVPTTSLPQSSGNSENKPFKPVTGYNLETGLKSYFLDKNLILTISVYHIVKNNNLTPDPVNYGDFVQTGQIISNGIDFDLTGNIAPAFILNVNYAFNNAKVTKDNGPGIVGTKNFGVPDHSANLWMNYRLFRGKLKGLSFGAGYQYMGKRSALFFENSGTGNKFLPVYNLLDAAVAYQTQKFRIGLNLFNITGTKYAALGFFNPATSEWRYTPGDPANFRLSIGINLCKTKNEN